MKDEDSNREETKTSFIVSFISGFNNHSVGEEILPEYKRNS